MTTYNTYQEAKINNPDCEIYNDCKGKFRAINDAPTSHFANGWELCKPHNYCMTVEKFLADGHKFVEGGYDAYLDSRGFVRFIGDDGYSHYACSDIRNISEPNRSFILRAEALKSSVSHKYYSSLIEVLLDGFNRITAESDYDSAYDIACEMLDLEGDTCSKQQKPKRTKVEYVKCEYGGKAANIVMDFENDVPLYKMVNDEYWTIDEIDDLFQLIIGDCFIYRRIETEIDERQEFIATAFDLDGVKPHPISIELVGKMFDSGKFKLLTDQ